VGHLVAITCLAKNASYGRLATDNTNGTKGDRFWDNIFSRDTPKNSGNGFSAGVGAGEKNFSNFKTIFKNKKFKFLELTLYKTTTKHPLPIFGY